MVKRIPEVVTRDVVGDVVPVIDGTAIVTVGFVISRSDHVRFVGGHGLEFVEEGFEDGLVDFGAVLKGGVGKVFLDLPFNQ